jgi:hypothetical protein
MKSRYLFLGAAWVLFTCSFLSAQVKLYESTFNGGVVTGGYSNGATIPSGSGNFNVTIPAGSTIRRAYFIAGRCGNAADVTVTLNGTPFTFNASNIFTTGFNTIYGGNSAVHAIDVTSSISPATSAYTIAVPNQSTVSDKYPEFYLYIAFDNASLPAITSAIFCNTSNLTVSTLNWTLTTTAPILTGSPVGLGILGGYATTGSDCENVNVNGTALGAYGGQDFNASSVWGCMSGFQYYNNTLTGYGDDNANQAISGTDALSNIAAVIPNNTTSIPLTFTHCGGGGDNHVWAVFLTASGTILPSKVLSFEAEVATQSVALAWEIENEDGISSYQLERSENGENFLPIHERTAVGASAGQRYNWLDAHPLSGRNWYRLRMIGSDGLSSFSEVRMVELPGTGLQASISPNPLRMGTPLQVKLSSAAEGEWQLYQLSDARLVRRGVIAEMTDAFALPTTGLAAGAYALELHTSAGSQLLRFVVQ